MDIIQHDSLAAYEREYNQVRGALVARGTSLTAYLTERGISRQLGYQALRGLSQGSKARGIRIRILQDVLAEIAA